MSYSSIAQQSWGGTVGNSGISPYTSSATNTTGADLLICAASWYTNNDGSALGGTFTDSLSNTWTKLSTNLYGGGGGNQWNTQFSYAKNATVGASQTFTWNCSNNAVQNFGGCVMMAFSGSDLTAPYDSTAGNPVNASTSAITSLQAGSI